tara:strand:+ start:1363 stop:1872 length:510 start_codon:yes stop_codon:yes gene_type:complete
MPKPNRQQKNTLIYEGRAPRQGPIYNPPTTPNNVTTPPEKQIPTLPVRNREGQNIQQGLTSGSNRFQGAKGRMRTADAVGAHYDRARARADARKERWAARLGGFGGPFGMFRNRLRGRRRGLFGTTWDMYERRRNRGNAMRGYNANPYHGEELQRKNEARATWSNISGI